MAAPAILFSLTLILSLCAIIKAAPPGLVLTLVNNCPYTIWPAIQPNGGHPVLERGGFVLPTLTHRSFAAPTTRWSGRIWARTGCSLHQGRFSCDTGDCGGILKCNGNGGAAPATLAQFDLHHGGHADLSSYGVSLVDGFNVPMTVTPHQGKGNCPVVGCKANLLAACPAPLQVRAHGGGLGPVMGCKSGCAAFKTDELCCRNSFNSPQTCKPSTYSDFFKRACPATVTYAHDKLLLMHKCSAARELKIIFCH